MTAGRPSLPSAPPPASTELRALERLVRERVRHPTGGVRSLRATVALNLGDHGGLSLRFDRGTVSLATELAEAPDTTIDTDVATITEVMEGTRSGVDAFLGGRLRVRGNLALSLRLDSLFDGRRRPDHFPRAGSALVWGVPTFYLEAGRGPPVVLLHGLGATNASVLPILVELARDHRVLAPDLPGFGESGKPLRSYHAAFFARWLRGFLDVVGIDRTHLVGNSMGGRVAIETGLRAPERVDRMVLLTPSPAFIRHREFVRVVRVLRPELALLPVPLSHRQVVWSIKRMFSRPARLPGPWYEAAADEFLRVFGTPRGRIAFFSAARQIYLEEPYGDGGFWDRLPGLRRPALFVWGQHDRLVPAAFARHVERALPGAASVVLRDCGHVPQYELPEETHRLVRGFLEAG
ncbi:MAG: alpha/beta fold hydrolase [Actinomycetota bacterium]